MPKQYIGGSFAPPLSEEKLNHYEALATACSNIQARDYMTQLVKMMRVFRETPASRMSAEPHPAGRGTITRLEDSEIHRIWDVVPWPEDCQTMNRVFDRLTGETRNAAYHLLWYAVELSNDREPCTSDKL